jgi:hypothetical protein
VPGVTLVVRDAGGVEAARIVAKDDGDWPLRVLPGSYQVEVSAAGLRTASMPVELPTVGDSARLDFRLEAGP